MATMKVWQKHTGNNEAIRVEIPIPTTPSDGFLVKVLAAGGQCFNFSMNTSGLVLGR